MPYSLWSHDHLLGESHLEPLQSPARVKFGWFQPTTEGERCLDVLTGARAALMKLSRLLNDPMRAMMRSGSQAKGEWPPDIRRTTAYADFIALQDRIEAMQLELRDAEGNAVACEDITVQDTVFTQSLAYRGKKNRAVAETAPPGERYQLQVQLPEG